MAGMDQRAMKSLVPQDPRVRRQLLQLGILVLFMAGAWIYQRCTAPQAPAANELPNAVRVPATDDRTVPQRKRASKPDRVPATKNISPTKEDSPSENDSSDSLVIRNLVLRDEDGNVVYRGNINLQPTLARIAADRHLRFSHDGIVFENRERRLPRQSPGYYREWVVPTPGDSGPGPQRLIIGDDGDVWYTADHYRSFRRIEYKFP